MATENPHQESVQYERGNLKWTVGEVNANINAFAAGLLFSSCQPGDALVSWVPEKVEKHAAQLAAAKCGMLYVQVDPSCNSVEDFKMVLAETNARCVMIEDKDIDNFKAAVPEMEFYDDLDGTPFFSRSLPNLRLLLTTAFDDVQGMTNFDALLQYNLCENDPLPAVRSQVKDSAPLAASYTNQGGMAKKDGEILNQTQVLEQGAWPVVGAILNGQYVTVPEPSET
ncbi:unnamed protein product [Chrysoparadoxa australica]